MTASPAWVAPTVRAVPWQPLGAVALCLAGVVLAATVRGSWPWGVLDVAAAGLAAAVVAGLRDPAADLLAALPTSAARRRTRRLLLLVPAGLGTWLAYLAVGNALTPELGWPVGPAVALVATGCAVATWAPARVAVEAGAAAPLLWMGVARATNGLPEPVTVLASGYEQHPWIVTLAALAVTWMGRNR